MKKKKNLTDTTLLKSRMPCNLHIFLNNFLIFFYKFLLFKSEIQANIFKKDMFFFIFSIFMSNFAIAA